MRCDTPTRMALSCLLALAIVFVARQRVVLAQAQQNPPHAVQSDSPGSAPAGDDPLSVPDVVQAAVPYDPHCATADLACSKWAMFRRAHPFPYQTIAFSPLQPGTLLLVLSEPPPSLGRNDLQSLVKAIFGPKMLEFSTRRWMIGVDGWVEDALVRIDVKDSAADSAAGQLLADEGFPDQVAMLHHAIWGTAFGAGLEVIEPPHNPAEAMVAPNLSVSHSELMPWFRTSSSRWRPVDDPDGQWTPWASVDQAKPEAWVSEDNALVTLVIPVSKLIAAQGDKAKLDDLRVPFRHFAVATDVIVGGLWNASSGSITIVGRARLLLPAAIPPLRFETFVQLVQATTDELDQSYERTNLVAGKLSDGDQGLKDWAPIYLSENLIDTELGALLNITDQILKSWSEGGKIEYEYFSYPFKPDSFLLGHTPLSEELRKKSNATTVLYNWNTSGSTSVVRIGNVSALATGRTGALPVTYGSDLKSDGDVATGHLSAYENEAYTYFSNLQDPNLGRVVQYTLLYQILRAAAVDPTMADLMAPLKRVDVSGGEKRKQSNAVVLSEVRRVLDFVASNGVDKILQPDDAGVSGLVDSVKDLKSFLAESAQEGVSLDELTEMAAYPGNAQAALGKDALKLASLVHDLEAEHEAFEKAQDDFNDRVRQTAKRARAGLIPPSQKAALQSQFEQERDDLEKRGDALDLKYKPLADLAVRLDVFKKIQKLRENIRVAIDIQSDRDDVRQKYIAANAVADPGWVKTPSTVLSWRRGLAGLFATGGHNLRARALRFEPSPNVKDVDIATVQDAPVVYYNPKLEGDIAANATTLARRVEHDGLRDAKVLQGLASKSVVPRSLKAALNIPEQSQALADTIEERLAGFSGSVGKRTFNAPKDYEDALADIANKNDCCIFVSRANNRLTYLARKNGSPPPTALMLRYGDNVSLRDAMGTVARHASDRNEEMPIVFLDDNPKAVSALASGLNARQSADLGLLDRLQAAGAGGGGDGNDGGLEVAAGGFDDDSGKTLQLMLAMHEAPKTALERLRAKFADAIQGVFKGALKAVEGEPSVLEGDAAKAFLDNIDWNDAVDGRPTVVMFRAEGQGVGQIEIGVAAGFKSAQEAAGVAKIKAVVQDTQNEARSGGRGHAFDVLLSLRERMAKLDRGPFTKTALVVRHRNATIEYSRRTTSRDAG